MKQLDTIRNDYIRYANCWEDADVLLKGLSVDSGSKVLSIGSAGDNSLSLLADNPKLVVAVDINPVQLWLIELKKLAIQKLDYIEFKGFLGFTDSNTRLLLFDKLKDSLSENSKKYWESNRNLIESGLIYAGKFERYFRMFRRIILPLIHNQGRIDMLFSAKSPEEQKLFFEEIWNNRRWRFLFKFFFSKWFMGRFGRDPEFLKQVNVPVAESISRRAAIHLSSASCQTNYFLQFIMQGSFKSELPHYVREENYEKIRNNIDKIEIFHGLAEDAITEFGKFNRFNLSNIFEYMNEEVFRNVVRSLLNGAENESILVYWNLLVDRKMNQVSKLVTAKSKHSQELSSNDKGFFYSCVNIDIMGK